MARVVPKHPDEHHGEEPSARPLRHHGEFVWAAFVKGATLFTGRLALISGFVGGCVLTYLTFVTDLNAAWVVAIALATLLVIFVIGADQIFGVWYQTAIAYAPTWERCRDQANNLTALTSEFRHDGTRVLPLDEVPLQRRIDFRREYMAGWMSFVEAEYDRACAAGYVPDFDPDRIATAELEDALELSDVLRDVAKRWRAAEKGTH